MNTDLTSWTEEERLAIARIACGDSRPYPINRLPKYERGAEMRIESFKTVAENAADAILAEINRAPTTPSRLVLANLVRKALQDEYAHGLGWGEERAVRLAMEAQKRVDAAKGDDFEGFGVIALIIGTIYGMALAGAVGYWLA